jgi:four helix bundle protein
MEQNTKLKSYTDLDVYQRTYKLSIIVCTRVIIKLPKEERFDLVDQLRRSSKAIPRLIAEGFGKRNQKRGFIKYLDDAIAENNETIVSLSHAKDIYHTHLSPNSVEKLIKEYEISGKQLFKLKQAWEKFT